MANADPLPTHDRTVSLWFFAPDVDSHPNLLAYGGAGTFGQSWLMINQTCTPGRFEMQGHGNVNRIDYAYPSPPVGKWYQWAVTTDSGKYSKIYINGEKVKEFDSFQMDTVVQGKDLAIGVSVSPAGTAPYTDENVGYFRGKLDDIRIYSRALSDQEIKDLYDPAGLVAYYPFNGNTEDVGHNGNHGQNHGAVFAPDMVGTATNAIAFNGTSAYVEVPDSPSLRITGTVSLTAWVKRTRFDQVEIILEKGGDWTNNQTNYGMGLNSDTYNDMFFFIYAGGWKAVQGPRDTEWHHYAVVAKHGDSDVALYIDGELKTADLKGGIDIVNLNPSSANLHIGAQVEAAAPYYGANVLDEVRIYNRALSAEEVLSLYGGVKLKLPKIEVGGSTFEVPVTIESVSGLMAADLAVVFDPTVILAKSVEITSFADDFAMEHKTSEGGNVTISMASATPVTGSGELAVIYFDAVGSSGSSTALTFRDVLLNDGAIVPALVNGSVTLSSAHSISGTCSYYSGSSPDRIPGVKLQLVGADNQTRVSNPGGACEFSEVSQGDWTLTPSMSDCVGNAIGAADAALVLKYKAGLVTLTTNQKKAADTTCNGSVTAMDAALILREVVGLIHLPFPGCESEWLFIPVQRSYEPLSKDETKQNFTGIVIGDVNGSWTPPLFTAMEGEAVSQRLAAAAEGSRLTLGKPEQTANGEIAVPVRLKLKEREVSSVTLELRYAGKFVTAAAVESGPAAGKAMVASNLKHPGRIKVALASAEPLTQSGRLFTILFKPKQGIPAVPNCTIKNVTFDDDGFQVGY